MPNQNSQFGPSGIEQLKMRNELLAKPKQYKCPFTEKRKRKDKEVKDLRKLEAWRKFPNPNSSRYLFPRSSGKRNTGVN